ncbi:hypothetical protein Tco_1471982, partial [Tanacetum coccineum]
TTEAEYVAAANCCGQVLWIQNQMLDYGFNFINIEIYIDNESTTCDQDSYRLKCCRSSHKDDISDEFGVKNGICEVNATKQELVLLGKKLVLLVKVSTAGLPLELQLLSEILVDFLNASTIRYSLIISPTIYASYIEQFWSAAKTKTVNNETQIHAKVDGNTIVISESSVRSNLHFNDEDGVTSLTNSEILENLALMGYEIVSDKLTFQKAFFSPQWKYLIHTILHCLSSKSTAWNEFSTNIALAVICLANNQKFNFSKLIFDVEGEGSGQPSKPQPTPSPAPPSHEVQVTTVASHPQKTQTPRRSKRGRDTETPQSGGPPEKVGDEAVHQELGGRVERAATTTASLDAKQDSGNILKTQSKTIANVPLSQGIGIGGSPRWQEAIGGTIS